MHSEYQKLISLTKSYLLEEFSQKEWKFCDTETFEFFKNLAQKSVKKELQPSKANPPKEKNPPLYHTPLKNATSLKESTKNESIITKTEPQPNFNTAVFSSQSSKIDKSQIEQVNNYPNHLATASVKNFLKKRFPALKILEPLEKDYQTTTIPVQKKKKPSVVILSFDKQISPFLSNLEIAISQELTPATIYPCQKLTQDNKWEELLQQQLKLIIINEYALFSDQTLMRYYREFPKKAKYYLGKIPLLLLADHSSYLKEPKLKPALWQQICKLLCES